jgi:hypothetical protein
MSELSKEWQAARIMRAVLFYKGVMRMRAKRLL